MRTRILSMRECSLCPLELRIKEEEKVKKKKFYCIKFYRQVHGCTKLPEILKDIEEFILGLKSQ